MEHSPFSTLHYIPDLFHIPTSAKTPVGQSVSILHSIMNTGAWVGRRNRSDPDSHTALMTSVSC